MTSNSRHSLPPRLMAHQPTRFATAQESTPSPSPGIRMRRAARPNPTQLTLRLAPEPEPPPPTTEEPTLLQALADLLLEALAQPTPGRRTKAATMEAADEPEDRA